MQMQMQMQMQLQLQLQPTSLVVHWHFQDPGPWRSCTLLVARQVGADKKKTPEPEPKANKGGISNFKEKPQSKKEKAPCVMWHVGGS
jgi:hypothetical protein